MCAYVRIHSIIKSIDSSYFRVHALHCHLLLVDNLDSHVSSRDVMLRHFSINQPTLLHSLIGQFEESVIRKLDGLRLTFPEAPAPSVMPTR